MFVLRCLLLSGIREKMCKFKKQSITICIEEQKVYQLLVFYVHIRNMNWAKDAYLGIQRSNESGVKNITPKLGCITISEAYTAMVHPEHIAFG